MTIEYKLFTECADIRVAAKKALSSRLFVAGWELRDILQTYATMSDRFLNRIALAYDGEKPIGIALITGHDVAVFTRKSYRRQGIGSALVKTVLKGKRYSNYGGDGGIVGSGRFFKAAGLEYTGSWKYL